MSGFEMSKTYKQISKAVVYIPNWVSPGRDIIPFKDSWGYNGGIKSTTSYTLIVKSFFNASR
ncbi:MAG TPA: hypothetical protein PKD55_00325 [Bellilinea sp.]|nr:hypothetical protein [Bellilinea sp.]